jgi:hypothetical protein
VAMATMTTTFGSRTMAIRRDIDFWWRNNTMVISCFVVMQEALLCVH